MSSFTENFKERWGKSFGEHVAVAQPPRPGIHPVDPDTFEPLMKPAKVKQEPVGILKRIWNDAVLGGDNKSRELETPLLISGARGIGKTLGIGSALATWGTAIAGLFTSTASIPVFPVIATVCGMSGIGGVLYGLFTKPEPHKPTERLVHSYGPHGISYEMITTPARPTTAADKFKHVMDCLDYGFKLPMVGVYRAINTPIRLTGYAAHAFGTAVKAAIETYQEDDTPPPPSPTGNLPAANDFTM